MCKISIEFSWPEHIILTGMIDFFDLFKVTLIKLALQMNKQLISVRYI
jgi:hypothetical protein